MQDNPLTRRRFGLAAAGALTGLALPVGAQHKGPWLADMHSHYGQFRSSLFAPDLGSHMRATGTTLVAWSIVDDLRWIGRNRQAKVPAPGELWNYFRDRLAECDSQLARWNLAKALTPSDIDAALAGEPRVIVSSEAANFLEGDPGRLVAAHAAGLRHTQLVHYIQSPLGDFQTGEPRHGGLTPVGAKVLAECKRVGILVDLAHGTDNLVDSAMDASDAVMICSHSWISPAGGGWQDPGHLARSLSLASARKIAARGGAVGLWTVRDGRDGGYPVRDVMTFADETMRMSDLIGPEHVAFGTDMEGAGPNPILSNYADLREVADNLGKRGVSQTVLDGIFIGNYARIVKQAMAGASTI
jgi:membrane dipeptidase